jgi:PP-loop superfamily ATP-utilizing enzyme
MKKEISILFSGGPDSTLAALKALDQTEKVHLLTFQHNKMGKIGKHRKVTKELKTMFGEERVVAYEEEITRLFNKFYFFNIHRRLIQYRTFYIPWICGACKLAMHIAAIKYNKAHGISTTYDGGNMESSPYFVDQMKPYIDGIKELYKSYEMAYDCPVYNIPDTDKETEKYGLTTTRDTKKEHVIFSTQHSCVNGLFVHAHARLYYRPFRGKTRTSNLGGIFLNEVLADCRTYISDEL